MSFMKEIMFDCCNFNSAKKPRKVSQALTKPINKAICLLNCNIHCDEVSLFLYLYLYRVDSDQFDIQIQ